MTLDNRIKAFITLGEFLKQFSDNKSKNTHNPLNVHFYSDFEELLTRVSQHNAWFTEKNVRYALTAIAGSLDRNQLQEWINPYQDAIQNQKKVHRIAVIMAGNIPLVGFHDFLCVLLSGNRFLGKCSTDDQLLLPFISKIVMHIAPEFEGFIEFTEGQIKQMDAVIATGSNNTSRYFEYYFSKYPCIIRRNRNSVAILTGKETKEELTKLGEDVFRYFGLGCRNVSKLFVPRGYVFDLFYEAILDYQDVIQVNKYGNNYDYNRTLYLMSGDPTLLDNNFLLLKESVLYPSPIGVLFYEFYDDLKELSARLKNDEAEIQCIVSSKGMIDNSMPFGQAQCPALGDYADGVDTMKFLTSL